MSNNPVSPMPAQQVTDEAVARFLADGRTGRFIGVFLQRECSVADAARRLGLPHASMAYWVNKMLALGLLKPLGKARGAGTRSQMRYTCSAPAFCVPRAVVGLGVWRDLVELFTRDAWQKVIDSVVYSHRDADAACLWVYRDPVNDSFWRVFDRMPAMRADDGTLVNVGSIQLTAEDYHLLQQDLNRLISSYYGRSAACRKAGGAQNLLSIYYAVAANQSPPA
jgi:hypothetical protein